eukprot:849828-Pyramimonas_sp.AAC.1
MHHTAAWQWDARAPSCPAASDNDRACSRAAAAGIGSKSLAGWVPEGGSSEACRPNGVSR